MSDYSAFISAICASSDLPAPAYEVRFAAPRKWRFDVAWLAHRVAIEIDGGVWTSGRHTRGAGWLKDQEKLNAAVIRGWRVLHYTPQQIEAGEWVEDVRRALLPVDNGLSA